jgi:uncharacterized protein
MAKVKQFRSLALAAALAAAAVAADFAALKPEGYVNDFAGVIDAGTKRELEVYCAQVERATGAQFALVTLPGLEGEPIEDVANLLYRKWGVGQKKTDEGILILLSINDRRSRVEVGYGLEPLIPDGYAGSVLRGVRPSLRAGDYGQALSDAVHQMAERIAAAKGVQIGQQAPRRQTRPADEGFPWFGLVVACGVLLFLLMAGGSRPRGRGGFGGGDFLAGVLLGNVLSGGSRMRSGGGFGGYDSGDSFGGFGGGDSGGGGASSDW